MGKLVYEFDSVYDRNGNNILNKEQHANPVHLITVIQGKSAVFQYVDIDKGIVTSKVELIQIHCDSIHIVTKNTDYWLKPHIRKEN